jgi:hypothetical protein
MDVTGATWRTSGYTSSGGNWVEAGNHPQDRRVLIRDTKDRRGPVLAFHPQSWRNFIAEMVTQRPQRLTPPEPPGTSRPQGEAEYQVGRDATPLTGSARHSSHQ